MKRTVKGHYRIAFLGKNFRLVSYDTKQGKALSARCEHWDGNTLSQVYGRYSKAKEAVFNNWFDFYSQDCHADNFSIVSHNCHFFSLGWFTTIPGLPVEYYLTTGKTIGKDVAILITPTENYMIVFPE